MKNIVRQLEERNVVEKDRYIEAYEGRIMGIYVLRTKQLKWEVISRNLSLVSGFGNRISKNKNGYYVCSGLSGVEVLDYVVML